MKGLKITSIVACLSVLIMNCGPKENKNADSKIEIANSDTSFNVFKDIDKPRTIYTGSDSLYLWPFEFFSVMTFKGVSIDGLFGTLDFTMDEPHSEMNFIDALNTYTFDSRVIDSQLTVNNVIVILKTIDGDLKREIEKGKKYKVIYSFKSDSEVLRTNTPTHFASGYYIVDIINISEKFMRQIPWVYKNN